MGGLIPRIKTDIRRKARSGESVRETGQEESLLQDEASSAAQVAQDAADQGE